MENEVVEMGNEKVPNKRTQRKRMAWFALVSMPLTVLLLAICPESKLVAMDEILTWYFIGMTSIVGAYVGFSSFEDKINKKVNE